MRATRRRCSVKRVWAQLGISERWACRALGQARSTQRLGIILADDAVRLTGCITELASSFGRYVYRRGTALLPAEGQRVSFKRVARTWCREGPKVPKRELERSRLRFNDDSWVRRRAESPDHWQ